MPSENARRRPPSRRLAPALRAMAVGLATWACQSTASDGGPSGVVGGASTGGTTTPAGGAPSGGGRPAGGSATLGSGGQLTSSSGGNGDNSGGTPSSGGSGDAGGSSSAGGQDSSPDSGGARSDGFSLVWQDEFAGPDIDDTKWEHEENCWGGGNNEDQCYVKDKKNSFIEAGVLHIKVLGDKPSGPEGGGSDNPNNVVTRGHSSARLLTRNKADFKYGRIEALLKLPQTQGLWPAFWMLPTDEVYGGWAASGEIDIMEAVNLNPDERIYGTLHHGSAWPDNVHTGTETTPASKAWENFHLYAVEWEEGEIRWFVDEKQYALQNKWSTPGAAFPAPFNERFHIILNVAIGGAWPGAPDQTTQLPQEMLVDFVRVYECSKDPAQGKGCGTRDPQVQPL